VSTFIVENSYRQTFLAVYLDSANFVRSYRDPAKELEISFSGKNGNSNNFFNRLQKYYITIRFSLIASYTLKLSPDEHQDHTHVFYADDERINLVVYSLVLRK